MVEQQSQKIIVRLLEVISQRYGAGFYSSLTKSSSYLDILHVDSALCTISDFEEEDE